MSVPCIAKAVQVRKIGDLALTIDHACRVPAIYDDEVLIKVVSVSLNPVDWKGVMYNFGITRLPWICGRDVAGIIVKRGCMVPSDFSVADRVLTLTDYTDDRCGSFQEYCVAKASTLVKIPLYISFIEASTLPTCFVTSMLSLTHYMKLTSQSPASSQARRKTVIIWGSGSNITFFSIQLALKLGYSVIVIGSPDSFEYLAATFETVHLIDNLVDDAAILQQVDVLSGHELVGAVDTTGKRAAVVLAACLSLFSSSERPPTLVPLCDKPDQESVKQLCSRYQTWTSMASLDFKNSHGKRGLEYHHQSKRFAADTTRVEIADIKVKLFNTDIDISRKLVLELTETLSLGTFKFPRIQTLEGLESIAMGLELIKTQLVPRNTKLVVCLENHHPDFPGWL